VRKSDSINTEWANLFRYSIKEGLEYCRRCFSAENLTFDHIIPRSLEGPNSRSNITILCEDCNNNKGQNYLSELPSLQKVKPAGWILKPTSELEIGDVTLAGTIIDIKEGTRPSFITTPSIWPRRAGCKSIDGSRPDIWVFVGAAKKELENAS
jgi:hypothetical protein